VLRKGLAWMAMNSRDAARRRHTSGAQIKHQTCHHEPSDGRRAQFIDLQRIAALRPGESIESTRASNGSPHPSNPESEGMRLTSNKVAFKKYTDRFSRRRTATDIVLVELPACARATIVNRLGKPLKNGMAVCRNPSPCGPMAVANESGVHEWTTMYPSSFDRFNPPNSHSRYEEIV
jgi:hypothetical protein